MLDLDGNPGGLHGEAPEGDREGPGEDRLRSGMELPASAREVLESDAVATLVTLNEDGSPHVTVAWVGLEGDEIVIGTLPEQRKLANMGRDPRVALVVQTRSLNPLGLLEYLVVHGSARITEGGAPELLQRLARTYLGPDVRFPPMPNPPPGYVIRITTRRVGGMGPWTDRGQAATGDVALRSGPA
jgi:PPOX class probable F420-dependent enzyme